MNYDLDGNLVSEEDDKNSLFPNDNMKDWHLSHLFDPAFEPYPDVNDKSSDIYQYIDSKDHPDYDDFVDLEDNSLQNRKPISFKQLDYSNYNYDEFGNIDLSGNKKNSRRKGNLEVFRGGPANYIR